MQRKLTLLTTLLFALCGGAPGISSVFAGSQDLYLDALRDFERYAQTVWTSASYQNAPTNSGYWGDGVSGGNAGIRGSCGVAVACATLVKGYPLAAERTDRLQKIARALNYAANTHVSTGNVCTDGLQWGHGWQTALWAGSMGMACMLVQADLPPETVAAVKRAIADEATFRAGIAPASGYVGDTKAEENGWNGNVVALAAAWLSDDTNAPAWLDSARRYLANTYTVPDSTGDPLASWITTTTVYPDYSLENHGFYHPTYQMVAGMSMGDSWLMASLCNPAVASELTPFAEHNVLQVWTNLNHLVLDSGEFAYPSGLDWELHDFEQNSYVAWLATHFGDPLAVWEDDRLAQLVRYRQQVNTDGRFVGESMSKGFFREAVEARRTAIAWLHHEFSGITNLPATAPGPDVNLFPFVNIISHRGPFGFVSLSFSGKIALMVEPSAASVPTNAFMTTPLVPGGIGLGLMGNPTAARLLRFDTNATGGFEADLVLTNGSQGTTTVYVNSNGKAVAIVEIPQPVTSLNGSSASFTLGIENDPLTGGRRLLEWQGGAAATFTNRTGVARNVTNDWVCVGGRFGVTAGPAGYFRYQTASGYNRAGAAEDKLGFYPTEPLEPRYAIWFPGQNAIQTASLASKVQWMVTATNCVLEFPGIGTNLSRITTAYSSPPFHPLYRVPASAIHASSTQSASNPPAYANDNDLTTFWVSLAGPTNGVPQWLWSTFNRTIALSQLAVYPRTFNGGYGPNDVKIFVNATNKPGGGTLPTGGTSVFQGVVPATSPLVLNYEQPLIITNVVLMIYTGYDRGVVSTTARNTQVVEFSVFERDLPGVLDPWDYWRLARFTDAEMANPKISGPHADPDGDGVSNLMEFALMGNPLVADAASLRLSLEAANPNDFSFSHTRRPDLGSASLHYQISDNLNDWSDAAPDLITTTPEGTAGALRQQITFKKDPGNRYYRLEVVPGI